MINKFLKKIIKKTSFLPIPTIGTHNGFFHCDEVMSCVMLTRYTKEFKDAKINRTRDDKILNQQTIVIDVGGCYIPEKLRFDHHQKEFTDKFDEKYLTKMSSAGLIYKHYGREILKNILEKVLDEHKDKIQFIPEINEEAIEILYYKLYENLFLYVDSIDNGVEQYQNNKINSEYSINSDLSSRIARLNPLWCEMNQDHEGQFKIAMNEANKELVDQVKGLFFGWYIARPIVMKAFNSRVEEKILVLEQSCPWKDHLINIERELNKEGLIQFILYPINNEGWRVQAVPLSKGSFATRTPLKKEWRGITDLEVLRNVSGIDDIVFCHNSGFIGGAKKLESALRMAKESLI